MVDGGDERVQQLRTLRALLLGREQRAIAELEERLDTLDVTPDDVADILPEAIALRAGRDDHLARALAPTLERAFGESVQRNPQQLADAIYPTLGPAIRKAIAEAIAGLVAGINRAMQISLSPRGLRWRFEAWRSGVPFGQLVLQRALVYRVEQVYLIHGETGLLLAHVTAPDLAAPDADVISGMLTAIRDFVSDSFEARAAGGLRTFTVGDVTMLVEPGPRALVAATVRGQHPPALLTRLQSTLELVHLRFAEPLSEFAGDNAPFEQAKPLLAECLETVLDTDRGAERRGGVPRVVWGLAAAAVLVLSTLAVSSMLAWRRARAVLANEPGWVTLDADRGWGLGGREWTIRGMRDPLARTPRAALAGAGFDTSHVNATWTSYVSADSAMVVARARRTLDPPASVSLTLRGDTLDVGGTVPPAWLARIATIPVPGVSTVDVARATVAFGEESRPSVAAIDAARVLFPVGAADLGASALRTLDDVAREWRALQSQAGESWHVVLTIVGRTDTTGSQEMNRMLSDIRAQGVARALHARGVPPDATQPLGIGTTNPIDAPDRAERARINRSVVFRLDIRARGRSSGPSR